MEPIEKTRDVTIGDNVYQLTRMNPRIGSWIVAQLLTKMLPPGIGHAMLSELKLPVNLPENRNEMTEEQFHNLQDHCLMVVRRYNKAGIAEPIMIPNGTFCFPDLDYDVVTIMGLTVHSLMFNVKPFFVEGALDRILQSFEGEADTVLSRITSRGT